MLDTLVRSDLARPRREPARARSGAERLDCRLHRSGKPPRRAARVSPSGIPPHRDRRPRRRAGNRRTGGRADGAGRNRGARRDGDRADRSRTAYQHSRGAAALCTIAMGRLGAAEMTYNSDLDLIFVYRCEGEAAASAPEAAARIVQKLIGALEARTMEGYAYKIDLRLRPSGNAGPLVASLAGLHRVPSPELGGVGAAGAGARARDRRRRGAGARSRGGAPEVRLQPRVERARGRRNRRDAGPDGARDRRRESGPAQYQAGTRRPGRRRLHRADDGAAARQKLRATQTPQHGSVCWARCRDAA